MIHSEPAADTEQSWAWPVLHEAQRVVLLDVLVHGTRSRADLARRSGLSRASLSRLTRDLGELGLVRELGAAPAAGRGRPPEMIEVVPESASFLGFKLTGGALYAAVVDLSANVVHAEEEPLVTREVEDVVALIARTTSRLREQYERIAAVGVCLAGDVREDVALGAVVVGSAFLGWDEVPIQALIHEATGLPVAVSNDVQALTAAHQWFGGGVGASSLAVIGIGAGIGCGIVVNDDLVAGAQGHPGKVGHLPVGRTDANCDRGHVGCVSAFVTIPAILRNADRASFWETIEAARSGAPQAQWALRAAAEALGAVIATIANLVDPERIIITGEGLPIAELYATDMNDAVTARLDPASAAPNVVLQPFAFTDYAWGAAVTAIIALV